MSLRTYAVYAIIGLLCVGAIPATGLATSPVSKHPAVLSHDLAVELAPATHELIGRDQTDIELPIRTKTVTFSIAPTITIERIVLKARPKSNAGSYSDTAVTFTTQQVMRPPTQRVTVTLPTAHDGRVTLAWAYRGVIDDPPKEPRHLRFVTPSETAGHIGPEGVYLSSESQWYPDIEGSLSAYRLRILVPVGWSVVTQGRKTEDATDGGQASSTWVIQDQSEALTLVANTFVTKSRAWKGRSGQHIELATYFFPDNAGLADEYLDATANYLDAYIPILGEFPFEKFAVVENFFASGLGMPSFTLLGSGSIKRHYVQPYALGHEIVHSWIGNSVFNRADQANWVEGLTTYLTNYYWHELTHDDRQAIEQRRMMLQGYSIYVTPERDYPVAAFIRKNDERDNAIGYHKSAFVFHLLRREIGDEAFWRGLKTFVSRYRNRAADWENIEAVFAEESRRDLRWFFEQWVERGGAPSLSLGDAGAYRVAGHDGPDAWQLAVRIQQAGRPFQMAVPITVVMRGGTETRWVALGLSSETLVELTVQDQPLFVQLDPNMMAFRRLARAQLPPMLNGYVTDRNRTVVQAFSDPASPLQQVITRIIDQESPLPQSQRTRIFPVDGTPLPADGSMLLLAGPDQRKPVQSIVQESCGDLVTLGNAGFQIDGQTHDGPAMAALFSCRRANVPDSVVTVLYGVTPQAVAKVSRFLFYYGWQSSVIFNDGVAVKRGLWQNEPEMKEVRIEATQ
ncbi:MAG: M1 family aminopeptidase [Nitrospira sp.]|nr:M1 family aminopeptidase [Nitrospira sp.]